MPLASTGTIVTRQPRRASDFMVLSTASCSIALVTRCLRPDGSSASAAPRIARLSLSVPPAVKTISDGIGADQGADRAPGLVQRGFGLLTEMVNAGRVAPHLAQGLGHPIGDQRVERGRRVMVQIDTHGAEMPIVAFLLTLSNKRTRQRFDGRFYTGWTSTPKPTSPGFSILAPSADFQQRGRFQRCGSVTSRSNRLHLRRQLRRLRLRRLLLLRRRRASRVLNLGGTW